MDFRKNFSERLGLLRKQKGVSLAALGEYLGVTDEAVRLLERGNVRLVLKFCVLSPTTLKSPLII